MKKRISLLLLLFCITFFGCDSEKMNCCFFYYRTRLFIKLSEIKDSRVKTIKITLKNLDGLESKYSIDVDGNGILEEISGIYTKILKRRSESEIIGENKNYFEVLKIKFWIDNHKKNLDKKRSYEIKMYINKNDKCFFTKKFSFNNIGGSLENEFDNMEYVMKNDGNRYIKITDDDIKKWLDGKP